LSVRSATEDVETVENETASREGGAADDAPPSDEGPVAVRPSGKAVLHARRAARRFLTSTSERPWYHNRAALAVLAVLLVIAPAVIAFLLAVSRPEVYVARSEVLFSVEDAFVDDATSETLALIGQSARVLGPVAEAAGLPLRALQQSVSTSVVGTTTVVALEVRRDNPDEAATLAESIAQQWVSTARRPTTPADAGVSAAIAAQTTRLGEVEAELASSDLSTEDRELLEQERDDLLTQIGDLQDDLGSLEGDDLFLGHRAAILAPAQAESAPIEPKPLQAAIAGAVIGLLLAGAVIALAWQLTLRE
jgi:capsular polysaccharide biosynthesis protein